MVHRSTGPRRNHRAVDLCDGGRAMSRLATVRSARPVDAASVDHLDASADDLESVRQALTWAAEFLGSPHPGLGRKGPVCPFIRHSFHQHLLYVTCRPEEDCASPDLRTAVRSVMDWFGPFQEQAPHGSEHLVTILVVLPRIDRTSSEGLDALQASLKDELVLQGLMIGQFHPTCQAPGLWDPEFRPLQSPVPLLAVREMVPSDLPFLAGSALHASTYFERYARSIPAHTRQFLVERLVAGGGPRPC